MGPSKSGHKQHITAKPKTVNVKLLKKRLGNKSKNTPANHQGEIPKKLVKSNSNNEILKNRLSASRFRYLNEMLYTTESNKTFKMFKENPEDFRVYHKGFQSQVSKWPINPIDHIIMEIKQSPKEWVVGDFGCGEAQLAKSVANKVYSFDFVAVNDQVISCDMAQLPLSNATLDVGVFCLSLMGVNISDFIREANRVLKIGGFLYVAEVESRFSDRQTGE